ncbi:hypothetical protein F4777DRAFT_540432 [Nemania sp. FL0916]|nr:hypothetical protein F4777DRAFT_540432 [Nemania sp. FL0916]
MSSQNGETAAAAAPILDLVTLIITTSPTPSAPSTDLISDILASFKRHCAALLSCRVIVVLDTYDRIGACMRLKKGQITPEGAAAVEVYKRNVKDLILAHWCPCPYSCPHHATNSNSEGNGEKREGEEETNTATASQFFTQSSSLAEYGNPRLPDNHVALTILQTPGRRVTFVEPAARLGFGLAVREALRRVETPYVWVQQHDWPLVRDIPLADLVGVMRASETEGEGKVPVKYVCLPAVRMLSYATSAHVVPFPALRALTAELKREFVVPGSSQQQPDHHHGGSSGGIPLTPLFFWHDKPHIASTAHYLARVFPSRLALARGDFIEDTVGQRARKQMKEGNWAKWACWLYYPGEGTEVCLQHRHGRKWRGFEADTQIKALAEEMRGREKRGEMLLDGS